MADDRVSRETAELIPLPPHTWDVRARKSKREHSKCSA